MKNLIKKCLLIVAVLTTIVMSGANINNNVEVNVIDSKLIDLRLKNSDGDLTISIIDTYGETLYTEKFEGSYFSKKYDLQTLPVGDYYFEIEGRTKINVIPFKVTSEGTEFSNTVESIYYKPIVRQDGDLLFISKVSLNNEDFAVRFYDEDLNMLYKEELRGDVNLGKTLNLMKLERGTYLVVMKSDGKSFEQKVYKK
jgi:hypothetical protein